MRPDGWFSNALDVESMKSNEMLGGGPKPIDSFRKFDA